MHLGSTRFLGTATLHSVGTPTPKTSPDPKKPVLGEKKGVLGFVTTTSSGVMKRGYQTSVWYSGAFETEVSVATASSRVIRAWL
jgi:hypothetical protein